MDVELCTLYIGVENVKRSLRGIVILTLGLIILILGLTFVIERNSKTVNTQDAYFIIKESTTLRDVSKQLSSKGIINSSGYFTLYGKVKGFGNKIQPGKYIVSPGMKLNELLKKFSSGKSDFAVVTIPEGYSIYQIASRLEENKLVDKNKFLSIKPEALDKQGLIPKGNGTFYPLEGYLFPDTYYIPYSKTPQEIAELMFKRFASIYTEELRSRTKELNLTTSQVITVASLIEKEAANDEERPRIAGVIYNRIKRGMLLQIDASVIYAVNRGEKVTTKIYRKDLALNSPYNTYLKKGFPPGPIANPGKASIMAALYPESHDYLYYVLGDSGGHVFSKTYEEHVQNVHKYIK